MSIGSAKDGNDESWRLKPQFYHLLKAEGHLNRHLRQKMSVDAADGEDHLRLAITRLAMALAQEWPYDTDKDE